jgi:hypothetical protein
MDFIKKHYEKVVLGVVLVGLAVGAGLLPWMISSERATLRATEDEITKRPAKPLPPLDLSATTNLLRRIATPMTLDFSTGNRLFNPVAWQRRSDGTIAKAPSGKEIGVNSVVVTKITPLYTIITLDSVMPATADNPARYVVGVEKEADPVPSRRSKRQHFAILNSKNDTFVLREVKGAPDAPQLIIQLNDTDERVSLTKQKPFKRVDGYMADLKYPPDNRTWRNQRVGGRVRIANEDYKIVAIDAKEVVLSAPSGKKTSVPYNPGS